MGEKSSPRFEKEEEACVHEESLVTKAKSIGTIEIETEEIIICSVQKSVTRDMANHTNKIAALTIAMARDQGRQQETIVKIADITKKAPTIMKTHHDDTKVVVISNLN